MVEKGYKQTEVGVIPEEWSVVTLEDIIKLKNGLSFKSEYYSKHGTILITPGNFKIDGGLIFTERNTLRYDGPWSLDQAFQINDLLMVMTDLTPDCNLLGKSGILKSNEIVLHNQRIGKISTKSLNTDKVFLSYFFNSRIFSNRMKSTATGSTVRHTSVPTIKKTVLAIPPLPEQTAIAEALSDMDALIAQTEKLIEKKKAIKQGMMQELLTPKEGWVTKKLGEVCDIKKGQLITELTRVDGLIPVIAGGKTPAYFHNKPNRTGKTITISGSGASAGYVSFHNYPIFASDCSTISESTFYNIFFIFYWLQMHQYKIYKMQTGGAQPHIHPSDLYPMLISLPSVKEQSIIGQKITDIDFSISSSENKLQKIKRLKQGMMQALLTGKIRLI